MLRIGAAHLVALVAGVFVPAMMVTTGLRGADASLAGIVADVDDVWSLMTPLGTWLHHSDAVSAVPGAFAVAMAALTAVNLCCRPMTAVVHCRSLSWPYDVMFRCCCRPMTAVIRCRSLLGPCRPCALETWMMPFGLVACRGALTVVMVVTVTYLSFAVG